MDVRNTYSPSNAYHGRESRLTALCRGIALFLGTFATLNIIGRISTPNFDATLWWLDLRNTSLIPSTPFTLLLGLSLLAFAIRPHMSIGRRAATTALLAIATIVALDNTLDFYHLVHHCSIQTRSLIPLSLFSAIAQLLILHTVLTRTRTPQRSRYITAATTCVLLCLVAPLLQMFCFGRTDYRRQADAVVVFGARTYADGRPSDALADRVITASSLITDGYAPILIVSGGPGDGHTHETQAMKRLAIKCGVSPDSIVVDTHGLNTQATARNVVPKLEQLGANTVLAVSHSYHLPRIKLAFARQGKEVYTVPARESYVLTSLPYFMAREIAAQWAYYLHPLKSMLTWNSSPVITSGFSAAASHRPPANNT